MHAVLRLLVSAIILAFSLAVARAAEPADAAGAANPEVAAPAARAAPVRFRNQALFEVDKPIGALSAEQRARAIERRLLDVASRPAALVEQLQVVERDGRSELYAGDVLIKTVTDADAADTGRTRSQLAADQLARVRQALAEDVRDRSATRLLIGAGLSAAATLVLIAVLIGLRRVYRFVHRRVDVLARTWRRSRSLVGLGIISAKDFTSFAGGLAGLVAMALAILAIYIHLQFVFGQFPWTHGLSDQMVDAAWQAAKRVFGGFISYLPNIFNIVIIIILASYALKGLKALFRALENGHLSIEGFYPEWASPTFAIVRFFVIAIATVMVFPYLPGSGSAGFQGVAAFLGLAVSLGGAGAIGNLIAGLVITYMRPFAVGDRVKIADAVGDVVFKNLLVVRLRTIKNVEIAIPNALVLSNHIINFSANAKTDGLILHTSVTIGYDVPWQTVHGLLIDAAKRVEGVLATPEPFVLQTSLDDFYVAYEINAYTDQPNAQASLYSRLHTEIQNVFNENGVEILSPHYGALRDGNAITLPSDHLPKDYKAPAFNLLTKILRPDRPA